MKTPFLLLGLMCGLANANAQPAVIAPPQTQAIALVGGTVHVGNGEVINNATIEFENGKITYIGQPKASIAPNTKVIDISGKEVYPGLIESATTLGLNELDAIRATHDEYEVGELNPSIRSIIAYNTDSRLIPTYVSNGITTCHIIPQSGGIGGLSSVVQLNAWNYEDATLAYDMALNIDWPYRPQAANSEELEKVEEMEKQYQNKVNAYKSMFDAAKIYCSNHDETNLKLEAICQVLAGKRKLIIYAFSMRQMMEAVLFAKSYNLPVTIAGAYEANKILDFLSDNKVSIVLGSLHSLPYNDHDPLDQRFKLATQLKSTGIPFSISMFNVELYKQRSLAFTAGSAAAYGLGKEQALQAITLDAARILGIDKTTGSLELGKDATIVISGGDILDMKSSKIETVYIQGRNVDLTNTQSVQYERYKQKYGLK
jgi:imidazolonepropionase-like amidohydrolase